MTNEPPEYPTASGARVPHDDPEAPWRASGTRNDRPDRDRYPSKSVSERAIGPSDLDALRTALWEDIRGFMAAQSAANATGTLRNGGGGLSMTSPGIPGIAVGLHPGYYASSVAEASDSTAPLDSMAVILCDQIRTALHYLDDLTHGHSTDAVCPTEPLPLGTRARLEQAGALLDQLNSRLSVIVNQVGTI